MPTCKDCGGPTATKQLCQPCAVRYSNKRMKALGKGKLTPERQKAWYRERQNNIDLSRELKGAAPGKVPIAEVAWLKRKMP